MSLVIDSAEALNSRGNAQRADGDIEGAAASYRRALTLKPEYPAALYNLGLALEELGHGKEAERCFRRLCELDPRDADAMIQLGALLYERSEASEARIVLGRAALLRPDSPHAHYHLGLACKAAGDRTSAREALETALKLDRGVEVLSALGLLLVDDDRGADAAGYFAEAVRLLPERADLHNNLGTALRLAERVDEAMQSFRRAHELQHDLAQPLLNLGDCHVEQGEHAAAAECYSKGMRSHPDHGAFADRLLFTKQQLCDWSDYDELCTRRLDALERRPDEASTPFTLLAIASTAAQQLSCARRTAQRLQERLARSGSPCKTGAARNDSGRVRVGYLSSDFHEHVTAYILAGLFEQHDLGSVEVFGYSCAPDDGGVLRRRIAGAMEHFVDIARLSDRDAAQRINADGIDILVDLNGYTQRARSAIAALRPAPIQVNFLGYPGTMGADFIDYIIVDRYVFRDADRNHFSEQPVFMPGCYAPCGRRCASATPSRAQLGLPARAFIFCCFNQAFKIAPDVFSLWMRLLEAIPEAVLWLLEGNPIASANLRAQARRDGVDPARLIFAPRVAAEAYLGRLPAADLFLDTLPYNAHTTAADALWAGVPVLTRSGDTFASRVAGSMLTAVGMPELIARSAAEAQALALGLARDPERLSELRGRLAASRSSAPLFDMPRYVRGLESAFQRMAERHRAGLPPRALEV